MRLDKFLKVSRLIKRRTVANEACGSERISVNGRNAKASYDVKIGDKITVAFGNKAVTVKVLEIKDTTKKTEASGMYEIISEEDVL
jgi:ribosomal 50S subunit-recycling heat shock protein